jgi:hypothetical protein
MRVGIDITNVFFRGALAMLSPDGTILGRCCRRSCRSGPA